jgi:hypothetical protein
MASSWPLDPPGHPWEFSWPPPGLLLALPGPPGLPSGSPLGSPTIHHSTLYYSLFKGILASLGIHSELCLLFGSSLGSATIHQTTSSYSLFIDRDRSFVRASSVPYGFSFGAISGMERDGRVKEGRAEDQEDQGFLKQLGGSPCLFYPSLVLLAFLLIWLSPRLPDNPSSHLLLQPVQRDPSFPRDSI